MGERSRRKGVDGERELVRLLERVGIPARRVPLSGQRPSYPGDVIVGSRDDEQTWECKRVGQGFLKLRRWLEDADVVAVRADRSEWLACLRLDDLVYLMLAATGRGPGRGKSSRECAVDRGSSHARAASESETGGATT